MRNSAALIFFIPGELDLLATQHVQPGDILAVRTPGAFTSKLIRFGAALMDKPNLANHIAVVHHRDARGILWALEGRPGGVGWRQATDYIADAYTVSNVVQVKSADQRKLICAQGAKLLGTRYDWLAIADDAAQAFGIDIPFWNPSFGGRVPGHLVCSSYAAYLYAKAGLKHPKGDRNVSPDDWVDLILANRWEG